MSCLCPSPFIFHFIHLLFGFIFLFFVTRIISVFSLIVRQGPPVSFVVPDFTVLYVTQAAAVRKYSNGGSLYMVCKGKDVPLCHLDNQTHLQHPLFLKFSSQDEATFKIIGNLRVHLTGSLKSVKQNMEDDEMDPDLLQFYSSFQSSLLNSSNPQIETLNTDAPQPETGKTDASQGHSESPDEPAEPLEESAPTSSS